ncbi:hypothetical protein F53441_12913 [Fusarium austroafricanum]|uniref:Alpha/beta hydrolase fold-3 domain-containing protein n=1 Tax=Fusarium austroafricanum TaxID=2364996 RepID=A0A8H4JUG4_9HYPO|nr:hypothetical protein F53441_12913 [Fusarium austroafricanum]
MSDFSCYGGSSQEWLALEQSLPPATGAEVPLQDMVRLANEEREVVARNSMIKLAPKVQIQNYTIPSRDGSSIQARSYRPVEAAEDALLPLYIHFQGGGFMFGTLDSEDAICARIAIGTNVAVLNIDYRHTPEFTYPTQWNDAEDAFEWAHENMDMLRCDPQKVIMGGISAGAWVAASFTLQRHLNRTTNRRPSIAGQVLMIPCLAHIDCYEPQLTKMKHESISSYKQNELAPMLSVSELRWFTSLLKIENPDINDLKINPGNASPEQVKGMPPTVLGIVGLDPLRDEALLYAKMLTEAGVPTDVNLFIGLPHGFRSYEEKLSASARWDKVIEDASHIMLFEAGADISARDDDGQTPLHAAAHEGSPLAFQALVDAGADLEALNNAGETPLISSARKTQRLDVPRLLVKAGANLNATTLEEESIVDTAAGYPALVKFWENARE